MVHDFKSMGLPGFGCTGVQATQFLTTPSMSYMPTSSASNTTSPLVLVLLLAPVLILVKLGLGVLYLLLLPELPVPVSVSYQSLHHLTITPYWYYYDILL